MIAPGTRVSKGSIGGDMIGRLGVAIAIWLSGAIGLRAQAAPVTIVVVRHAEKGPETPDPSLTEAGVARANALARILADAGVGAIFTSEFKRTKETAAPLAAARGLTPRVIEAGKTDQLVTELERLPAGSRALVVSHSNLVPLIVQRLSGEKVADLTDTDYDRFYLVTRWSDGRASVTYLHYTAPPR